MNQIDELFEEAIKLSIEDRLELAERIQLSVPHSYFDEIDKAHAEEAERRIDALERGEDKSIPLEEAMAELRKRYQR